MKKNYLHKVLALLLILSLVVGICPLPHALAAESTSYIKLNGEAFNGTLQQAYNAASDNDTITISGTISLETGLHFEQHKDIKLVGTNNAKITIAEGSEENFSSAGGAEGKSSSLLIIGSEKGAAIYFGRVVLDGITFDAKGLCRCVRISGTPQTWGRFFCLGKDLETQQKGAIP